MKSLFIVLCAASLLPAAAATKPATKPLNRAKATLKITGMTCDGCAKGVRIVLERVPGVKSALVERPKGRALVLYDPSECKPTDMVAAVRRAKYGAFVAK
jgi:copper chaperone CopZ